MGRHAVCPNERSAGPRGGHNVNGMGKTGVGATFTTMERSERKTNVTTRFPDVENWIIRPWQWLLGRRDGNGVEGVEIGIG